MVVHRDPESRASRILHWIPDGDGRTDDDVYGIEMTMGPRTYETARFSLLSTSLSSHSETRRGPYQLAVVVVAGVAT